MKKKHWTTLGWLCPCERCMKSGNSQHPVETLVHFRVDLLEVVQRDVLSEQLLVKRKREAAVQVVVVKDGHADDTTHEMKVR